MPLISGRRGWSQPCRTIRSSCNPSNFWLRTSSRGRNRNVHHLLDRLEIAAMLPLLSTVSVGPALVGDSFVSLKMNRLPVRSVIAPVELTTRDGKVVKSSTLAGKVVPVNF